ncbi:MAG: hypothetical protein AAFW83_07395 [Pseudomonadota bacterium]
MYANLREDRLFVRGDKDYILRENPQLPRTILLPDVEVYLKNIKTGAESPSAKTDVRGVYNVLGVAPGTYNVCWRSTAYLGPCDPREITVGSRTAYPPAVYLMPRRNEAARVVAGTVSFEDGTICRLLKPSAEIDLVGETISTNERGKRQVVRANAWGEYVIPQVVAGDTKIDISCPQVGERSREFLLRNVKQTSPSAATSAFGSILANQLTTRTIRLAGRNNFEMYEPLPGARPSLGSITATWDGRRTLVLPPEAEVELRARDNGNSVAGIRWEVTGGSLKITGDKTAIWKTPASQTRHSVEIFTLGPTGQWAQQRENFTISNEHAGKEAFSGTVIASDTSARPNGLRVTINGEPATVSATGGFKSFAEFSDRNRYAVTVSAPGYLTQSEIYDRGRTGTVFTLKKVPTQAVSAESGGLVLDPKYSDPEFRRKKYKATSLRLPAGGLVREETGEPYFGDTMATLSYFDSRVDALPGDYLAEDLNGNELDLLSYGAVQIDLYTPTGDRLQLKEGKTAELAVPVAESRFGGGVPVPPRSMRVWTYNESTGIWEENQNRARLQNGFYVTQLRHFSTINMDRDISGGASACVRVTPDFQRLDPEERQIRVTSSSFRNGAVVPGTEQSKVITLDNRLNAIYGLNAGDGQTPNRVYFELLDSEATQVTPTRAIPNSIEDGDLNFVLEENTQTDMNKPPVYAGALQEPQGQRRYYVDLNDTDAIPSGGGRRPAFPYQACQREVRITRSVPPSGNQGSEFLTLKDSTKNIAGTASTSGDAYYSLIDGNDAKTTLHDWLAVNGFQPAFDETNLHPKTGPSTKDQDYPVAGYTLTNPGILELSYLNSGDLGSGRKMQCLKGPPDDPADPTSEQDVFCIVGNHIADFGDQFDRDPNGAVSAHEQNIGEGFATVAMEFAKVPGAESVGRVVTFYAFAGTVAGGQRVSAVKLDQISGFRSVPNVCQVCHGGSTPHFDDGEFFETPGAQQALSKTAFVQFLKADRSSFREFDLEAITQLQPVAIESPGDRPGVRLQKRLTVVKNLNCEFVVPSKPLSTIVNTISQWYRAGVSSANDPCPYTGVDQQAYLPSLPDRNDNSWSSLNEDNSALGDRYDNIAGRVCRTCHIALDDSDADSGLNFERPSHFEDSNYAFCVKFMPHAQVTYNKFWTNREIQGAFVSAYGQCSP